MRHTRLLTLLVALSLAPPLPAQEPAAPAAWSPGPSLRDFLGANNWPSGPMWGELGLGWGRGDFSWAAIEPQPGEFRFDDTDRIVLAAHAQGCEVLLMLGYFAPWAVDKQPDGTEVLADPAAWTRFVEAVVARYSRPPFSLRYFQVWNEPTRKAGFWHGRTDEEFLSVVYLPAARIIRRYGCMVVFGGWPCSDGIDAYERLLDQSEAWRWTDILDIHYYGLAEMVRLHDRYVATGKCKGVWQTEIGYHPYEEYIPNLYPRALCWGLKSGWGFAEQLKLFWFASWGAGPDSELCLSHPSDAGNVLSAHGLRVRTLQQVLGSGRLSAFDDYACEPDIGFSTDEEAESVEGFRCGQRIVIAFQLSPETARANPELRLSMELGAAPVRVELVTSLGDRQALACAFADGEARIACPVADIEPKVARNWGREVRFVTGYIVADPAAASP